MAINAAKQITELDFQDIRDSLQTYLQSQDRFKDYDFNGSGLSILLDTLAYNTHYQAFYTNMVATEMFMDSATKRESVVSHAKQIAYTPHSKKSSRCSVKVSFSTSSGDTVTIPARTLFTGTVGSTTYTFYNTESVSVGATGVAPHVSDEFLIYQGQYKDISYVVSEAEETRYRIPSLSVDVDGKSFEFGIRYNGKQ